MQLAQCDEALWHYNHPNSHANVAFDTLLPHVQQPFGLHHICTKLYQLPVTKLRSLQKEAVDTKTYITNSPENKLVAIILDVVKFRLYKSVQTVSPEETPTCDFLKLNFRNKGLDAVNISNILNHNFNHTKKGKRKVQRVPQTQTAALPRH